MRVSLSIALIFFLLLGQTFLLAQERVVLPAHTKVQLSTLQETVAKMVQTGDIINLQVVLDIKIKGELIVRSGAFAQAQVRYVYINPRKRKPELVLVPTIVQAVDGTLISLYGDGLLFGGKGANERPVLPTSSRVQAAVHYATKVYLK